MTAREFTRNDFGYACRDGHSDCATAEGGACRESLGATVRACSSCGLWLVRGIDGVWVHDGTKRFRCEVRS